LRQCVRQHRVALSWLLSATEAIVVPARIVWTRFVTQAASFRVAA
jgi:hypothetical protein